MRNIQGIITGLEKTFNFFKPPDRIGDVIDYKDNSYLIIGIERVRFFGRKLSVLYTCQILDTLHSLKPEVQPFDNYADFYIEIDIDKHFNDRDWKFQERENLLRLGQVFHYEGHYYRWVTYTDLEFEFTTLKVSGLAQPVYPITAKEARKTLSKHYQNTSVRSWI